MKKQTAQRHDGKAFGAFNIAVAENYRDPKYRFIQHTTAVMSPNGWLKIFELIPFDDGQSSFTGRWDGGSRDPGKTERYDLDIDIHGVSKEVTHLFKHNKGGYWGGHAKRIPSNTGRAYEVSISTPDGKIFEGTVRLNLLRRIEFEATVRTNGNLTHKKRAVSAIKLSQIVMRQWKTFWMQFSVFRRFSRENPIFCKSFRGPMHVGPGDSPSLSERDRLEFDLATEQEREFSCWRY